MVDTRCIAFYVITNRSIGKIVNSNGPFNWRSVGDALCNGCTGRIIGK